MTDLIELPAEAVDILAGRSEARDIAEGLNAAYWLHGRDNGTSAFLLNVAHKSLHTLASEMGYRLVPLASADPTPPTVATLKAEWAEVCKAMADGYWRGTEADALAEIERIKSEIAKLEDPANA